MTSDGISKQDWDAVTELAASVASASAIEDDVLCDVANSKLLEYLDRLESIYGRLPSILATRADYVDDVAARKALLLEALQKALAIQDKFNAEMIAEDLREIG